MEITMSSSLSTPRSVLSTSYFGGGTPSLLSSSELGSVLNVLYKNFSFTPDAEFTLECNPEDITAENLKMWIDSGINRLSIGVQSFRDEDLIWMKRGHTAQQSIGSVKRAQDAGFTNITLDLIYHLPGLTYEAWKKNLETFFTLDIPHISAYTLTVEKQTLLGHEAKKGIFNLPSDEEFRSQFRTLAELTSKNGYEQYEISNFAKPGFRSRHNSSYWSGEAYLGIGPSAHGFDGDRERSWNVANNAEYIRRLESGKSPVDEKEILSDRDKRNEYLMTRLRLLEGISLEKMKRDFGEDLLYSFEEYLHDCKKKDWVSWDEKNLWLTLEGKMVANEIISELFEA
jgi:oxygen-independent coproporphyrinogen-3 oxidase